MHLWDFFWAQGAKGKKAEKKEISFNLYGFNGKFSASPVYPLFLEKTEDAPLPKPPLYTPVAYEDSWEAMMQGKETEDVFYEELPYDYVIGTRLDQSKSPSGAFFSTIYQIDTKHKNQRKKLTADLPEGLIYITPFAKKDDLLFCSSSYAVPNSESIAGGIISLNLKTGEQKNLLPMQSAMMGAKGDWFYFAVMGNENGGQDGIYRLDIKGETVERLSPLPAEKFNTAYYGSFINYMDGTDIYFSWPNKADMVQEYALYRLDSRLGRVAKLS